MIKQTSQIRVRYADTDQMKFGAADYVLTKRGGHGAVRELCDLILSKTDIR